jgi:hypothetical protein
MGYPTVSRRALAYVFAGALVLLSVVPAGATDDIFGTIQVSGPAWVSSQAADWARLSATRPLVSGDRLKTGSDGYLLADMGDDGVVGLYGDAEVSTHQTGETPVIDVHRGKVAFHLAPDSNLKLKADQGAIVSQTAAADGYVEYGSDGVPVVVVEEGNLMVQVAGADRTLARGERMALRPDAAPMQVAAADKDEGDSRKAAAAAAGGGGKKAGLSAAGWTAIGIVAAGVGGAFAISELADDDDDGPGS